MQINVLHFLLASCFENIDSLKLETILFTETLLDSKL